MKKTKHAIASVVLAAALALTGVEAAFAVDWGSQSNLSTGGRTYVGASGIDASGTRAWAQQYVSVTNTSMPANYGGARARVIINGSVTGDSGWIYNGTQIPANGKLYASVIRYGSSGQSCYSQGYFSGWDGNNVRFSRETSRSPIRGLS